MMEARTCLNCFHFTVCMKVLLEARKEEAWNFPEGLGKWYEYYGQNCDNHALDLEIKGRQLETKLLKEIAQALKDGFIELNGICKDEAEAKAFYGNDHSILVKMAEKNAPP